jgi:DNA-binding PadR family transcriptional regulator
LQALEEAGEVAFHWDTDSRGPARKVYTLTPLGWERLEFWRSEVEGKRDVLQTFLDHFKRSKAKKKKGRG